MTNTEVKSYVFTVKEGAPSKSGADDAPVWLMLEPSEQQLQIVGNGFLSMRLMPGANVKQAKVVAGFLNSNISGVGFTRL